MAKDLQDESINYYPICIVPPECHYNSFKALVDDILWFEESRAHLYKEHPQYKPPTGQFEKVRISGKKGYILLPTSQDYGVLYRGQGNYYNRCLPTIFRQKMTDNEVFAEKVRIAEFRLFLEQFEVTRYFEDSHYFVDYVGLAQHYGLKTDVLDVTSDIHVAMFFAMCDYDNDTDSYKPKHEDKPYIGYIYAILANENSHNSNIPFAIYSDKLNVIGLQPFKRPGRQKGFAYHVGNEGLINGYLYSFNYTKDDSMDIFNYFHRGEYLWCKDEIVDVVKVIAKTRTFSSEAVSLATRMFDQTMSINKRIKSLKQAGYTIVSRRKQPWTSVKKNLSDEQWLAIQSDIIFRKVPIGKNIYSCLSTQEIGKELLLNYIYGSVDSPKDYNSGICYIENKSSCVFGIQSGMHHEPLQPSEDDGKIHAEWKEKGNIAPRARSFQAPEALKPRLTRAARR